jgi:type III pantothenate kinase
LELVIDIGNTWAKAAVFINNGIHLVVHHQDATKGLHSQLKDFSFERIIISSTRGDTGNCELYWSKVAQTLILTHKTALPIKNEYGTPETLGKDRLAAVIGGRFLYSEGAVLAIDAGTCITYDLLTADDRYLGGNISPGATMRFKALNNFTGALPLVNVYEVDDLIGSTTNQAIATGVINGLSREINQTITDYEDQFKPLNVILCGGEAKYFVNRIKKEIFANQNLVLIGLHKILLFND